MLDKVFLKPVYALRRLPNLGIWFTSFKVYVPGIPYCIPSLAISPVRVLGLPWSVTNFLDTSLKLFVKLVSKA